MKLTRNRWIKARPDARQGVLVRIFLELPMRRWGLILMALAILLLPSGVFRAGEARLAAADAPFRPGEKLIYDLSWEFVPAGTAWLEVSADQDYEGQAAYRFVMNAQTNSFFDRLYKVRDRLESYTDRPMKRALLYRKNQQEGKHRRDIEVIFDWERLQAETSNFGKKQKPVAVVDGAFDPLSVLYAFRLMPLEEQSIWEIPVCDGRKSVMGRVRVAGREEVIVKGREYQAFVLEPDLKDLGGVFRRSDGASLRIWVTDDEARLPVKVTSKVAVGSFLAELKEVRRGSP